MKEKLGHIYQLGVKELLSLRSDTVLLVLMAYTFTLAIYVVAEGGSTNVNNASIAVVDEDRSALSHRIRDALRKPYFQTPADLILAEIDMAMDTGRYTFLVDIPPGFEADVLRGRRPTIQINVDATAMSQAGVGSGYIQEIIRREVIRHSGGHERALPVRLVVRAEFNPNLNSGWYAAIMQLVDNITLLALILSGAALIREREHGTIEHLLVMPITPAEIMISKIWANALVVTLAAVASLYGIVQGLLNIPTQGSIPLFVAGAIVYLFSATSLGVFLASLVRTMPQFGLLVIPVYIVIILLSGGNTPLESMPRVLQYLMQLSPSTHFVKLSQAILFRGAGLDAVWKQFALVISIGTVLFVASMARFRKMISVSQA